MGIFDNEETFLTQERDKLNAPLAVIRRRDNPFRSLGAALKMWDLKNSPEAKQLRDKKILMQQIDVEKIGDLDFAIEKFREMGDTEGVLQLLKLKDDAIARQKKDPELLMAGDEEVWYVPDGKGGKKRRGTKQRDKTGKWIYKEDAKSEDGGLETITKQVRDKKGLVREGLFNKKDGKLIRYLGAGYEPDSGDKDRTGTWDQTTIIGPNGKNVGVIFNSTTNKWQVPGMSSEISTEALMRSGYDITEQSKAGISKWVDKTLWVTDPETGKKLPVVAEKDQLTAIWRWKGLDGKEHVSTTLNLPKGVTNVPPQDPKDPHTRPMRDGQDMVTMQWNRETLQWDELSRGSVRDVGTGIQNWSTVFNAYEKSLDKADINKQVNSIASIKIAARNEGGLESKVLQTSLANMFGNRSRAMAEITYFNSFGDITDRMAIAISKFFEGVYTEEGRRGALRLAYFYERDKIRPALKAINERFDLVAIQQGVDPRTFMQRIEPSKQIENFDYDELKKRGAEPGFVESLDLFERQMWDDRINYFIKQL